MQEMKLQDLKTKSPTELLSFAEEGRSLFWSLPNIMPGNEATALALVYEEGTFQR